MFQSPRRQSLATIRLKGKLNKWVDDKGFGFITPEKSTQGIFVHISAFNRTISRRPKVGDTIFYHVQTDKNGKTRAFDAVIEGVKLQEKTYTSRPTKQYRNRRSTNSWRLFVLCSVLVIGIGSSFYDRLQFEGSRLFQSGTQLYGKFNGAKNTKRSSSRYTCHGKTRCSQMSSCEEARFYIRNCPGTKMDGDGDGIPCERQHCY
jgi:cold shock CspA family protein